MPAPCHDHHTIARVTVSRTRNNHHSRHCVRDPSAGIGQGDDPPLHACRSWCSSRSTSEQPKTNEHDFLVSEPLVTVRSSPAPDCTTRLALPEHLSLLALGPFPASPCLLPALAGVLSDVLAVACSLLSHSLSGRELPLDHLHGPGAAAAAAAARCAAVRVSRAACVDRMPRRRRVDGGARAAMAARRTAAAPLARAGAAVAWQTVATVPAAGVSGSLGERAVDFCVCPMCARPCAVDHVLSGLEAPATVRASQPS